MTALNVTSSGLQPPRSIVSNLDRLVSHVREWLEDRLPWYDREAEQAQEARTEAIRRRSTRLRAEAALAEQRLRTR